MSVFDGPRTETRRILHQGVPAWVTLDGDELVLGDGRRVREADAAYLAPCEPTKILCIHLNYESRRIEFRAPNRAGVSCATASTTSGPMSEYSVSTA